MFSGDYSKKKGSEPKSVDNPTRRDIDVICQMRSDGEIMPIKIQLHDEDGELNSYKIKQYRVKFRPDTSMMPDVAFITSKYFVFECKVQAFNRLVQLTLYYDTASSRWSYRA